MISGIHHVGISSPNIDRLIAFYRDVIGFEQVYEMILPASDPAMEAMLQMEGVTGRMVMMRSGTAFLELLQFDTPKGQPKREDWQLADHGHNHICLMVDDIDAEYERLKAAGMPFFSPPRHNDARPTAVTYGCDPDGNRIELVMMKHTEVPHHYANRHLERLKDVPEAQY